jgi:tRNA pseudouridine38-40 synthase
MYFIDVQREGEKVIIELSANAFLHHMVRNIAGVLMAIGTEKQPVSWTQELLEVKSRKLGGVTAPSDGLHLAGVHYPPYYGIIKNPIFNKLPADARRFD